MRAQNLNTIDELPDSSWFTNRILARAVPIDEAARGPLAGAGPAAGTWTVSRPKTAGFAPGFTMEDGKGETWFVSFDARSMPEAATGAILVANKIFWTLGYWQAENHLISVRPDQLAIASTATVTPMSGEPRPMKRSDLDEVLRRAHQGADGSYRAVAARALPGRVLGGFRYHGTRPDDPNDIVPHEHRRELRALKVFGAWTNLVDMKAGNTLDTLITTNGRGVVRHYLQDVGSTFGTGANGPREYDEGWEYVFEGAPTWKRLVSLGFYVQPWQTADYVESPAIGRFEGSAFDPPAWKPRVPTGAFLRARADDNFWAARRVAAFSNEMIRALVQHRRLHRAGRRRPSHGDPGSAAQQDRRRVPDADQSAREFHPRCGGPFLRERSRRRGRGRGSDQVDTWSAGRGSTTPPVKRRNWRRPRWWRALRCRHRRACRARRGRYLKAQVSAVQPPHQSWTTPIDVYFRRTAAGWKLVGLTRQPDGPAAPARSPATK